MSEVGRYAEDIGCRRIPWDHRVIDLDFQHALENTNHMHIGYGSR